MSKVTDGEQRDILEIQKDGQRGYPITHAEAVVVKEGTSESGKFLNTKLSEIDNNIGTINELKTYNKSSTVAAINELAEKIEDIESDVSSIIIDQREEIDGVFKTDIVITGDIGNAEGATTYNNVISWIRANSHLYLGKYDEENQIINIAKLYDGDSRYYDNNGTQGAEAPVTTLGNDTFLKLPVFYYRCKPYVDNQGNIVEDVWKLSFCKTYKDGDWLKWDDRLLIGAEEAYVEDEKAYSVSGKTSTGNISFTNFDTYFTNRGANYSMIQYPAHKIMALLFYAFYGSVSSQLICGVGTTSYSKQTGLCNVLGMNDTTPANDTNGINFWGLRNWWGNKSEWLKGVVTKDDAGTLTIVDIMLNKIYDIQSGVATSNTYNIVKLYFGENGDIIPTKRNDDINYSNCYQDGSNVTAAAGRVAYRSGFKANLYGGVGCLYVNAAASYVSSLIGSRLQYYGDYNIVDTIT